jgi:chorismate mutase
MQSDLSQLRIELDQIDQELIKLLAIRMKIVTEVGKWKKANNYPVLDPSRWDKVLSSKIALGKNEGLSPGMIADIWNRIHEEALDIEMKLGKNE